MDDLIEREIYDPTAERMIVVTSQDIAPYLRANAEVRASRPEGFGKYRGDLVHVGNIPTAEIERMRNGQCCTDGKRYNLLSADKEEVRRALLHIQTAHKELLTVNGKPFARSRPQWR